MAQELIWIISFAVVVAAGIALLFRYGWYKRTKEGFELKHVSPSSPMEKKIGLIGLVLGCVLFITSFLVVSFSGAGIFESGGTWWYAVGAFGGLLALIGGAAYFEMVGIPYEIGFGGMKPRKITHMDRLLLIIVFAIMIIVFLSLYLYYS